MESRTFRTPSGITVPAVTAEEMGAIDRVAIEDVGLDLLQMMENAGRTLAAHVLVREETTAIVVAGNGGNGGGGLACARHLANHELDVAVVLDRDPTELTGAARQQARILDKMDIPMRKDLEGGFSTEATVIVDALIGYGLSGTVRGTARRLIESMRESGLPIVSLDIPSGLDATSGRPTDIAVDPTVTVTLALPKTGLTGRPEKRYLVGIGIPHTVYERLDIEYVNPFGNGAWVELRE